MPPWPQRNQLVLYQDVFNPTVFDQDFVCPLSYTRCQSASSFLRLWI